MDSTTDSKPLKKASGSLMILLIFLIITTLLRIYTLSNMIPKLFATWNIVANP
ncbi:hypothetical protein MMG00_10830 [Ignatzschineria rhizosphaerae]|uniref:Uncharacterized protein n=1 Tax=Ignatzschineria rhizosphaerae TaxID=2923279 RepID=A0ABY3X6S0_9GAMM|nr:hypothetical protein [Ignatzschineria rhizosphaerae]UNM95703.1 hypothetical protein MMG00_10830 [Ignatzschineria rhizosphaerae]